MSDYKLNVSNVTNIYYINNSKTFYQNSISKFYRVGDIKFDNLIQLNNGFFELIEWMFNKSKYNMDQIYVSFWTNNQHNQLKFIFESIEKLISDATCKRIHSVIIDKCINVNIVNESSIKDELNEIDIKNKIYEMYNDKITKDILYYLKNTIELENLLLKYNTYDIEIKENNENIKFIKYITIMNDKKILVEINNNLLYTKHPYLTIKYKRIYD